MMRSDASLKGKIKALAKKSNLKPQELLLSLIHISEPTRPY